MPCIICSYCQYVGQGDEYKDQIQDVEAHEEHCSTKSAAGMADRTDAAYEQARADSENLEAHED